MLRYPQTESQSALDPATDGELRGPAARGGRGGPPQQGQRGRL